MDCWKLFPNNIDTLEIKKSSFHSPSSSHAFPLVANVKADRIFLFIWGKRFALFCAFLVRELLSRILYVGVSSFKRLWKVLNFKKL